MSNTELPKSVDPYRLAEQKSVLEGFVPLRALSRFADCIVAGGSSEAEPVCDVTLTFSQDAERRRIVAGQLSADVVLECQRCMKPMNATLTSQFKLGFVTSDAQAQQLPKELEPYMAEDFSADLWVLVEDELLLVLPPFPKHGRDECSASEALEELEPDADEVEGGERDNPFNVLADLKTKKH
ncbi:YceD family protein [Marinobacter caseinilyticus]|uniref:YceD family protein n=1 Tax=Marinobacter caseinilyticus TaxID=2692195 RepID=UPI00140BC012|nr:YceD family protein [Marinobacter caseinilyticus]